MAPPVLATPRLTLRPYRAEDRAGFVALNTDAEVRAQMDGPTDVAAAHARFDGLEAGTLGWRGHCWAVTATDGADYLGHVFLSETDVGGGGVEIGILLHRAHWGHRYATEALQAVLTYAWAATDLDEVLATIDEDHTASIVACERAGLAFLRLEHDEDGAYRLHSARRSAKT